MVAGYYFQRPVLLFFSLRSWITCGDPNVLRGGYNALSRLRRIRSFLFLRLGKRACPLINKNALSALLKGHCAQDWIVFAALRLLFGGVSIKKSRLASQVMGLFSRPLLEASFGRVHKKSPTFRAGLFLSCPGLDSNQHILANAAT